MKRTLVLALLVVTAISTVGCTTQHKDSYFGGDIIVNYYHTPTPLMGEDNVAFVFHSTGRYKVSFTSLNPVWVYLGVAAVTDAPPAPNDFDITITEAPREHIVRQPLPGLRITITRDGNTEYRDFPR